MIAFKESYKNYKELMTFLGKLFGTSLFEWNDFGMLRTFKQDNKV